jgi:hypothetical protein
MSKTAVIALSPVSALFGRLLAGIDRLLLTNADIAVRNPATFVSPREAKLNIFENGFEFFRSHFFSCDCARRSCFSVKSRLRQFHPLRRYSLEAWYTE